MRIGIANICFAFGGKADVDVDVLLHRSPRPSHAKLDNSTLGKIHPEGNSIFLRPRPLVAHSWNLVTNRRQAECDQVKRLSILRATPAFRSAKDDVRFDALQVRSLLRAMPLRFLMKVTQLMSILSKLKMQLQQFWAMAITFFEENENSRQKLAALILLALFNSGAAVLVSYVMNYFWTAFNTQNVAMFQNMFALFLGAIAFSVPANIYHRFLREQLAVEWREWMTNRMLQLYKSNRVYYSLKRGNEIDNPDQRIAEDVRSFTSFSLSLFISSATSSIDLVAFSAVLYSIQPQLFRAGILYALFGTATTAALGRKLFALNSDRLRKEADFRYSLVRLREYAEPIAFYAGEANEGKKVSKRMQNVADNQKELNLIQRNLESFTTAYRLLTKALPVVILAPQHLSRGLPMGVTIQACAAFDRVVTDLSAIVDQFESLSYFSAGIDRLSTFMNAMKGVDMGRPLDSSLMKQLNETSPDIVPMGPNSTIKLLKRARGATTRSSNVLTVYNLTLSTPDRSRQLINGLELALKHGENLLIVGNSGVGKSSFLRALAGLWTAGSGKIERPSNEDMYILPQKPYCFTGTLKEQLLYPNVGDFDIDDEPKRYNRSKSQAMKHMLSYDDLLNILKAVGLEELPLREGDPISGLETVRDWGNTLSLGEQQRLAFGRLLVHRPHLAVLDEATSALDVETEAGMYRLLEGMAHNGTCGLTYITVGHRSSLLRYHDLRLRLNSGGQHATDVIDESARSAINATQDVQLDDSRGTALQSSSERLYTESEMADILKVVTADVRRSFEEEHQGQIDKLLTQIKSLKGTQASQQ